MEAGSLYPPIAALRRVTARIAEAVVREAREDGVGRRRARRRRSRAACADAMWEPAYIRLVPA